MIADILQSPPFITPWTIFLVALILVVGAIIALTIIERNLNKKISQKKISEEGIFSKKINLLRENKIKPDLMLSSIDVLAREFFEKRYKINKNLKYSALSVIFKKNNDFSAVKFCEKMQEALYAGEELSPDLVNNILNNLDFLINSENREKDLNNKNLKVVQSSPIANTFKIDQTNSVKQSIDNTSQQNNIIKKTEDLIILSPQDEREVFRLKNYLKEGLNRGYSINLLRQKLQDSKFNDKIINEAVNRVKLEFKDNDITSHVQFQTLSKPLVKPLIKEQIILKNKQFNQSIDHSGVKSLDNYNRIKERIIQKRVITSQDSLQ